MGHIKLQRLVKVIFLALGFLLLIISWWYLQQSYCVADLKSGLGDIEGALSFEKDAVIFYLSGILFLFLALYIHIQNLFKFWWICAIFLGFLIPLVASVGYFTLIFLDHASWACLELKQF